MKFQDPCMHGLKVMLCIKKRNGRTHTRTDAHKDGRTNVPEAICLPNFFENGGIKKLLSTALKLHAHLQNMR